MAATPPPAGRRLRTPAPPPGSAMTTPHGHGRSRRRRRAWRPPWRTGEAAPQTRTQSTEHDRLQSVNYRIGRPIPVGVPDAVIRCRSSVTCPPHQASAAEAGFAQHIARRQAERPLTGSRGCRPVPLPADTGELSCARRPRPPPKAPCQGNGQVQPRWRSAGRQHRRCPPRRAARPRGRTRPRHARRRTGRERVLADRGGRAWGQSASRSRAPAAEASDPRVHQRQDQESGSDHTEGQDRAACGPRPAGEIQWIASGHPAQTGRRSRPGPHSSPPHQQDAKQQGAETDRPPREWLLSIPAAMARHAGDGQAQGCAEHEELRQRLAHAGSGPARPRALGERAARRTASRG